MCGEELRQGRDRVPNHSHTHRLGRSGAPRMGMGGQDEALSRRGLRLVLGAVGSTAALPTPSDMPSDLNT